MKITRTIACVYTLSSLLSVQAVHADPQSSNLPQKSTIECLDTALQRLSNTGTSSSDMNLASGTLSAGNGAITTVSTAAPAAPVVVNSAAPAPTAGFAPDSSGFAAAPPVAPPIATNADSSKGIKARPRGMSSQAQEGVGAPVLWVYEFSASWCPSCRQLKPVVEEAAAKYNGFIKFVPVNVDKNQELVKRLNIAQIPTVMVVDRSGRTLNRLIGFQQGTQIDVILNHYKSETMAQVGSIH